MKRRQSRQDGAKVNAIAHKIFISYRRDDAADPAERLYDHLVAKFGKPAIFMDVDAIPIGIRFPDYLKEVVEQTDIMLVIIGPRWLDIAGADGRRRLEIPEDYVRLEVEAALRRQIPLIPVLVAGAAVPSLQTVPASLRPLFDHQAISIRRNPDFDRDVTLLIENIEARLAERAKRAAEYARQQAAAEERARRVAAAEERARRRAKWAQALAPVMRPVSRLRAKLSGRIGPAVAALLLIVAFASVLYEVGPLGNRASGLGSSNSTPTSAPSPTLDATAATQTAMAGQVTATAGQATAVAADATATATFIQPYVAARPGLCDQGGALWHIFDNSGQFPGTISCTSDSMLVNGNASAEFRGITGGAGFTAVDRFPSQYRASVDISFGSKGSNADAGFGAHFGAYQYNLGIHADGTWYTGVFNGDQYAGGNTGHRPAAASYTLVLIARSNILTFWVNGIQVDKRSLTSDATQPTGLGMGNGAGGPAYYRHFVFTPLLQ